MTEMEPSEARPDTNEMAEPARARAQRHRRLVAIAAVVVLVIAISVVVVVVLGWPSSKPSPTAGSTAPATSTPSPTVGSTAPATSTPSPTPTQLPVGAVVGAGELADATLTGLDWHLPGDTQPPCLEGTVTFKDGRAGNNPSTFDQTVLATARLDVNRDGVTDVVALVGCRIGEASEFQVIAVTLSGQNTYSMIGRVVSTSRQSDTPTDTIQVIDSLATTPDGLIQVRVGDYQPCCATPMNKAVRQLRGYAWTGRDFQQVAGSTTFLADHATTALTVTAPGGVWSAPSNDISTATLKISIRNVGSMPTQPVTVVLHSSIPYVGGSGGNWTSCPRPSGLGEGPYDPECTLGTIAPGRSVSLTLPLTLQYGAATSAEPHVYKATITIDLRVGDQRYSSTPVDFAFP